MCRYFDFDAIIGTKSTADADADSGSSSPEKSTANWAPPVPARKDQFKERVYVLLSFFARNRDEEVRFKSFVALGMTRTLA